MWRAAPRHHQLVPGPGPGLALHQHQAAVSEAVAQLGRLEALQKGKVGEVVEIFDVVDHFGTLQNFLTQPAL